MAKKEKYSYLRTARYGRKIRLLFNKAKKQQTQKYECPRCGKKKVKRESFAIWKCNSCNSVFAGGAYRFSTPEGQTVFRLLSSLKKNV